MRDPFATARSKAAMQHQATGMPQAPAATASPMAAMPMQSMHPVAQNFLQLSKQMGLGHLNLAKDPVMAKNQLMQHLHSKFGANYMDNPEVQKLLSSFNDRIGSGAMNMEATPQAGSMKALLGGPTGS